MTKVEESLPNEGPLYVGCLVCWMMRTLRGWFASEDRVCSRGSAIEQNWGVQMFYLQPPPCGSPFGKGVAESQSYVFPIGVVD